MLECVVNVSEGRSAPVIAALAGAAGTPLLDVHSDPDHNRSVLTLAGEGLAAAVRALARRTVELVDITGHRGAHPRIGALDVVPFAPLEGDSLAEAIAERDSFAAWAASELCLPSFCYGPERSLPDIRRRAFRQLAPDFGPRLAHPTAGAVAVGARKPLVAYNLWLAPGSLPVARHLAASLRCAEVRTLALEVGGRVQVSCNLVSPGEVGPAQVYDAVAAQARVARAELVGLLPAAVLATVPQERWQVLGLNEQATIEGRLRARRALGAGGGRKH